MGFREPVLSLLPPPSPVLSLSKGLSVKGSKGSAERRMLQVAGARVLLFMMPAT
jgi:hypothetical protein